MVFAYPYWFLLILLVPLPWLLFRRKGYVGFSNVNSLNGSRFAGYVHFIPNILISLAFVALAFALARPQALSQLPFHTVRARDIVIAVDKSGSMGGQFNGTVPPRITGNTELDKELPPLPPTPTLGAGGEGNVAKGKRRIDAAQAASLNFVRDRFVGQTGDRIGVLFFDTAQYWAWPLTRDLKTVYRKLQLADQGVGGGTNFGERPPGPVDAAIEHFGELGQSTTRVLIMVTDGEDNLSASALSRLEGLLTANRIKLYVIGVGEALARKEVDIMRLAESVGGTVFRVENGGDLDKCFQTINSLEKSPVQVEGAEKRDELFFYFAGVAMILFILGYLGEALVLNQ